MAAISYTEEVLLLVGGGGAVVVGGLLRGVEALVRSWASHDEIMELLLLGGCVSSWGEPEDDAIYSVN